MGLDEMARNPTIYKVFLPFRIYKYGESRVFRVKRKLHEPAATFRLSFRIDRINERTNGDILAFFALVSLSCNIS